MKPDRFDQNHIPTQDSSRAARVKELSLYKSLWKEVDVSNVMEQKAAQEFKKRKAKQRKQNKTKR